jgi:hypothetical protein
MGRIRHHAIIITGTSPKLMRKVRQRARQYFRKHVSGLVRSQFNGHISILIPPDGSFEGWPESDHYDRQRARFVRWLDKLAYADGSHPLNLIEVEYGGEEPLVGPGEQASDPNDDIPF